MWRMSESEGEWEMQASIYRMNKSLDERCSIENMVSGVLTALCGDRWKLYLC